MLLCLPVYWQLGEKAEKEDNKGSSLELILFLNLILYDI